MQGSIFRLFTPQITVSLTYCVKSARKSPHVAVSLHTKHPLNSLGQRYIVGIPIRSNLTDEDTENYAALVSQLAIKAHHVVRLCFLILIYHYVTYLNLLR